MECPNCGLFNPDTARTCDCGRDLRSTLPFRSTPSPGGRWLQALPVVSPFVGGLLPWAAGLAARLVLIGRGSPVVTMTEGIIGLLPLSIGLTLTFGLFGLAATWWVRGGLRRARPVVVERLWVSFGALASASAVTGAFVFLILTLSHQLLLDFLWLTPHRALIGLSLSFVPGACAGWLAHRLAEAFHLRRKRAPARVD
jgi:hypothetical protein